MKLIGDGRTSKVYRLENGLVFKTPRITDFANFSAEFERAIEVEKALLLRLGVHPRIIQYHGPYSMENLKDGLLLGEANCGTLQSYIDNDNNANQLTDAIRKTWCLQIAEAVAYIHEKGIVHRNLSTDNILPHKTQKSTDIVLADFGSSRCEELGFPGDLIPDPPFLDPQSDFASPRVDVFSLGIVLYIIATGNYPFHTRPAPDVWNLDTYQQSVEDKFRQGIFPPLDNVLFGEVIAGCCREHCFESGKEVLAALGACDGISW
ncbi:kinase-like protein [Aaosphaeria arxii CBS 175.79]|uniref:Kinase-like protein n=1 Tax=Aaosphaeria arxii CBS 175.79 TaxID=1450172 RepID=A0A6A5Y9H4_9PLEO|nr:kinase-like protein [Aaosphaeria arxii CBS 175.79]KAF2021916.1 kinase-like protein [Aaosphaeria arxii CBS 175.79]